MNIVFLSSFVIFGIALWLLALGVVLSNKPIRGSCGGGAVLRDANGEPLDCGTCPNRDNNPDCPARNGRKVMDPIE